MIKLTQVLCFVLLGANSLLGQEFSEAQKISATNRANNDQFGYSGAISGEYAIVGAPFEDENEDDAQASILNNSGSAYIYKKDNDSWVLIQKIVASDRADLDFFGHAVAIDENRLVVGAYFEDHDASESVLSFMNLAGSAYIFEKDGNGSWNQVQKITAIDRSDLARFGNAIAISGNYIIAGAPFEAEDDFGQNTMNSAGACYLFERDENGLWLAEQKIIPSDRDFIDRFGESVSISGDYAVVGAPYDEHDASGGNILGVAGSAYIFERIGGVWTEVQKIVANDRASEDFFGTSVSISGDRLVVGAFLQDKDTSGGSLVDNSGAAYVFERDEYGVWSEVQKLVASDRGTEDDQFGKTVSISGDRIVVGAFNEDEDSSGSNTLNGAGAVYVFERGANSSWSEIQKIVSSDRSSDDFFGEAVSISGDSFLACSRLEDEDSSGSNYNPEAGSAYIFDISIIEFSSGMWSGGSGNLDIPNIDDGDKALVVHDGTPTLNNDATLASITIESGASLSIGPTSAVTVSNTITLHDIESLVLESDASGTASIINHGVYHYNNNGSVKAERFIHQNGDGSNNLLNYHYIGSPIDNHAKFTDMADSDLYAYRESDLTWLYHNGFDSFENFSNGKGYAIRYNSVITKAFTGNVTNEDLQVEITLSDHGGSTFEGFNLLANPYPCAISASDFVTENSSVITNNLYFWNGIDYATYNTSLASGTAGGFGPVPDGNIALGQAFMVEATTSGTQMVDFTRAMRGTDSDIFYKTSSFPKLRLLISSEEEQSDVLLTGHHYSSNTIDTYDAKQLEGSSRLSLGTVLYGRAYDIESVPELSGHEFDLVVNSLQAKEIMFTIKDVVGVENLQVYLEDRENATLTNLSKENYSTHIKAEKNSERFKLRIAADNQSYRVWINDGKLVAYKGEQLLEGTTTVYGLDGRMLSVSTSDEIKNWNALPAGVYLITIDNQQESHTTKIIKQ